MNKVVRDIPTAIRAETFNSLIDAARELQSNRHRIVTPASSQHRAADTVLVRNESGRDVPRFGVLGIAAPIITPRANANEFANNVTLRGALPTIADHAGRFVVTLAPIAQGKIGPALIDGLGVGVVRIETEGDRFADVEDDNADTLVSGDSGGAELLWVEPEADRQTPDVARCVLRLGTQGSTPLQQFRVRAFGADGDTLLCRTWDGAEEGTEDVKVLLPHELRKSRYDRKFEILDGATVTYTAGPTLLTRTAEIRAENYSEKQAITPQYVTYENGGGENPDAIGPTIIVAASAGSITGGLGQPPDTPEEDRIDWMVQDARAWAETYTQGSAQDIVRRMIERRGEGQRA